ncbi:MAG: hypothetical protein GYA66_04780 [Phyllobacteriaceae bacterium]|jgi:hypothetical protein|nr:hypothetical protein [Phyllobacteriaceae bacterium]
MTASENTPEKPGGYSLLLNFLPLANLAAGLFTVTWLASSWTDGVLLAAAWLFVLPALLGRLIMMIFGRPAGRLHQGERAYRVWWALTQLQMPFNRIPLLEELLRLIPGLYAAWIWLWGGHLSPLAYVAPGVVITDRFAISVGRGAVLGTRSSFAGHMAFREATGAWCVVVAAPDVGAHALVGGDAGLGPGARLLAGQSLPYGRKLGPHATWPRAKP